MRVLVAVSVTFMAWAGASTAAGTARPRPCPRSPQKRFGPISRLELRLSWKPAFSYPNCSNLWVAPRFIFGEKSGLDAPQRMAPDEFNDETVVAKLFGHQAEAR
jgi:hypothetical protein